MANRYIKSCSISSLENCSLKPQDIHLISVRMAVIKEKRDKKEKENTNVDKDVEKREYLCIVPYWLERKLMQSL